MARNQKLCYLTILYDEHEVHLGTMHYATSTHACGKMHKIVCYKKTLNGS